MVYWRCLLSCVRLSTILGRYHTACDTQLTGTSDVKFLQVLFLAWRGGAKKWGLGLVHCIHTADVVMVLSVTSMGCMSVTPLLVSCS